MLTLSACLLQAAPAAAATTLYASPTGGGSPPCPESTPCSLSDAINAANPDDEVVALGGTYPPGNIPTVDSGVTLRGVSGPRPVLQPTNAFVVNGEARHLLVDGGGQRALSIEGGSGSDLVLSSSVSMDHTLQMIGSATSLRDSLVVSTGDESEAIYVSVTDPDGAQIRNVTAIATGADSYGIRTHGIDNAGMAPCYASQVTVSNAIARGAKADLAAVVVSAVPCTAVINVSYSNFHDVEETGSGASVSQGAGNQTSTALTNDSAIFVDTTNYRQRDGSPTANAGGDGDDSGFVDPDGDPRVGDGQVDIGADELPSAPVVSTDAATAVAATSAELNGTVAPQATTVNYKFEYGTTPSLGSSTAVASLAGGAPATAVKATVSGLSADQTIYYRVWARSGGLQPRTAAGATMSFTTLPTSAPGVTTGAAEVGPFSALLQGLVDPNRRPTTWSFVWTETGSEVFQNTPTQDAGDGDDPVPVSTEITGLRPRTAYTYEVAGTNAIATALGSEETFTTPPFRVEDLTVKPKRFRIGSDLPQVARVGGVIKFSLNADARVKLKFFRKKPGRRVHGKCKPVTRENRDNKRCTRLIFKGKFAYDATSGDQRIKFEGPLSKKTKLGPGKYRLVARAKHESGAKSNKAKANFRLLRKR